jgi:hypothetical protein
MRDTTTLEGCHVRHCLDGSPNYREGLDARDWLEGLAEGRYS